MAAGPGYDGGGRGWDGSRSGDCRQAIGVSLQTTSQARGISRVEHGRPPGSARATPAASDRRRPERRFAAQPTGAAERGVPPTVADSGANMGMKPSGQLRPPLCGAVSGVERRSGDPPSQRSDGPGCRQAVGVSLQTAS